MEIEESNSSKISIPLRWLLGFLVALDLVKHVGLLALGQSQPWGDSTNYWPLAMQVARGDWWMVQSPIGFRTPGYPWFLAICQLGAGTGAMLTAVVIQHGVAMLTTMLTGVIAFRLFGSLTLGIVVYALSVFLTARDLYCNWVMTEAWATFWLTACHAALIEALLRRDWRWYWGGAVLLAVGILFRPALVVSGPSLVIAGGWLLFNTGGLGRAKLVRFAAGLLIVAMLLTPWCLRNFFVFGRFNITTFVGRELWTAHFSPWAGGELDIPMDGPGAVLRSRLEHLGPGLDLRHNWSVSPALTRSGMNDAQADELMSAVALQAIRRQPGRAAFRTLARCATFWYVKEWDPPPLMENAVEMFRAERTWRFPAIANVLEAVIPKTPERYFPFFWTVSCLCWVGVLVSLRPWSHAPTMWLLAATFVSATLLTAVLEVPLYRYRIVVEPLTMVCAIRAICWGAASLRSGFAGRVNPPVR